MAKNDLHVRNNRPNRVILAYAGLRVVLERRGSREDTATFPEDARTDPTIARWLRQGRIEEITKEQFLDLSARTDAFDPNYRSVERREDGRVVRSLEPETTTDDRDAGLKIRGTDPETGDRTPTVVDTDRIDKTLLSPRVDYREEPEPTPRAISPQETEIQDLHRGMDAMRPVKEDPAEAGRAEAPNVASENVATPKKVPAKKKTAGGRPRTKKS